MGPRLLPRPIAPDQIILCAYEPLPSKAAQTCSKTSSIMLFSLLVSAHDPPPRSNDPLTLDKRPFLLTGPLLLQRGPNKMPESTATAAKESYNNVIQICAWDISYLYLQVQGRIGSEREAVGLQPRLLLILLKFLPPSPTRSSKRIILYNSQARK